MIRDDPHILLKFKLSFLRVCFIAVLVGHMNWLMLCSAIAFVLIGVIILISAICYSRHRARYYTNEEKRGKMIDVQPVWHLLWIFKLTCTDMWEVVHFL